MDSTQLSSSALAAGSDQDLGSTASVAAAGVSKTSPSLPAQPEALVEETLLEEVSIDGMCGVY